MAETPAPGDGLYRQFVVNMPSAAFIFDRDLRLLVADGDDVRAYGYDPVRMTGQLIEDVLPAAAFTVLEGPYRAALAGRSDDFDYNSPASGAIFRLRVRPLTDAVGHVVGGMSMSVDVTKERARESQLEQARHLLTMGSCAYERRSGWTYDDSLLALWGLDAVHEPAEVIDGVVLPEDRSAVRSHWQKLLADGGTGAWEYRIRSPVTGVVLTLHCACSATVAPDGLLLTAVATHIDITAIVQARAESDRIRGEASEQRTLLLRRVSDLLASTSHGVDVAIQNTAELAAGALGEACIVRVLSTDQRLVEGFSVAHRCDQGRRELATELASQSAVVADGSPVLREVLRTGTLCLGQGDRPEYAAPASTTGTHYCIAPIRYDGTVLGMLNLYRPSSEPAYTWADADLVQLLADRVGATIDASRSRKLADRERVGRRASDVRLRVMTKDQSELVLQLDQTESRERALLANAVHDEPLQLVVAAILRLDNLRERSRGPDRDRLDDIARILELSVEQLRKLAAALTPPDLRSGLRSALEQLAGTIFMGSGTAVSVVGPTHVHLDPNAKTTVYQIVREGLVNARKHARAAHVTLDIRDEGDIVGIRLTDDGIGIAHLDAGPGHLGLTSMRARAAAANARLIIDSALGRGTTVELILPTHLLAALATGHGPAADPIAAMVGPQ